MDGVGDGHAVKAGGEANKDQQLHIEKTCLWLRLLYMEVSCARVIAHAQCGAES